MATAFELETNGLMGLLDRLQREEAEG